MNFLGINKRCYNTDQTQFFIIKECKMFDLLADFWIKECIIIASKKAVSKNFEGEALPSGSFCSPGFEFRKVQYLGMLR